MSDHYIALNRGVEGFKQTDFVTGTAPAATAGIEIRILDGAGWNKKEAVNALRAFERFLETWPWVTAAGVDVKL